jgi:hypothetical protein
MADSAEPAGLQLNLTSGVETSEIRASLETLKGNFTRPIVWSLLIHAADNDLNHDDIITSKKCSKNYANDRLLRY